MRLLPHTSSDPNTLYGVLYLLACQDEVKRLKEMLALHARGLLTAHHLAAALPSSSDGHGQLGKIRMQVRQDRLTHKQKANGGAALPWLAVGRR